MGGYKEAKEIDNRISLLVDANPIDSSVNPYNIYRHLEWLRFVRTVQTTLSILEIQLTLAREQPKE